MGKNKEKTQDRSAVIQDQTATNQNFNTAITENRSRIGAQEANTANSRAALETGYAGLNAPTPSYVAPTYTSPSYSAANVEMRNFDEGAASRVNQDVANLRGFAANGGIDDASAARFRGNGVFDEFARTGGLSGVDRSNILAKSLSPISSYATGAQNELDRRRAVQGGYGPGFDASSRALRRDTARGIADTSLNAELGILNQVNAGRQWGATGMSGAESSLQGLRTNNMLRGNEGAISGELGLQNSILGQTNANNQLQRGLASDSNNFNLGSAGMANNFSLGSSGMRNQFNAQAADRLLNVDLARLQGLGGMYNSDVNQYQSGLDRGANLLSNQANTNLGYHNARNGVAERGGIGSAIMNGLGSAASAIAPFLGGGRGDRNNNSVWSTDGGNAYNTPIGSNNNNTIWGDGMINEDYSDLGSYPGANQPNPSGLFQEPTWDELQRRQGR